MILAEKLTRLRKKNGWSQEELADRMEVSRQAVSKWESAQTIPNLEKLLQLAELFGVTTDYLLKDEMENEEFTQEEVSAVRKLSLSDANLYLEQRWQASGRIAFAVFLCILSPICLLLLGAMTEPPVSLSENLAGGVGLTVLFLLVAAAVAIFLSCGFRNAPFEFLETEPFETEYGVTGMVRERQSAYRSNYVRSNLLGVILCVLSPVLLLIGAFTGEDLIVIILLCAMLVVIGIGVLFLVTAGVRWASFQKLLQQGEFSPREKRHSRIKGALTTVFWLLAVAVYLGWSFSTNSWNTTWIVWPVAGVLYAAMMAVCGLLIDQK